jgi:hypothetical protein
MSDLTLRRRIVVLVMVALLSVAGASASAAAIADDANAAIPQCKYEDCGPYGPWVYLGV